MPWLRVRTRLKMLGIGAGILGVILTASGDAGVCRQTDWPLLNDSNNRRQLPDSARSPRRRPFNPAKLADERSRVECECSSRQQNLNRDENPPYWEEMRRVCEGCNSCAAAQGGVRVPGNLYRAPRESMGLVSPGDYRASDKGKEVKDRPKEDHRDEGMAVENVSGREYRGGHVGAQRGHDREESSRRGAHEAIGSEAGGDAEGFPVGIGAAIRRGLRRLGGRCWSGAEDVRWSSGKAHGLGPRGGGRSTDTMHTRKDRTDGFPMELAASKVVLGGRDQGNACVSAPSSAFVFHRPTPWDEVDEQLHVTAPLCGRWRHLSLLLEFTVRRTIERDRFPEYRIIDGGLKHHQKALRCSTTSPRKTSHDCRGSTDRERSGEYVNPSTVLPTAT